MSNPRRTPMTRPESGTLSLKTNLVLLKKGATFHSPTSPSSISGGASSTFTPPSLPRRSQTNLDDVIDSHRRRAALNLGNIDKALAGSSSTSPSRAAFRDNSLPLPQGILEHTLDSGVMPASKEPQTERRVLRPRNRRSSRHHDSDSGLGTSVASSTDEKRSIKRERSAVKTSTITKSAGARSVTVDLPALSARATNRIYEHTLKPLLAKPSFKNYHPLVLECPKKIQSKEIVCLRDIEKTLLLAAPERAKLPGLYLDFCLTAIRCVQATVEYLGDREQTRPRDVPYSSGYFIDLVDQIRQYAQQLADAREKEGGAADEMDVDSADEIKLHGGLHVNGRPAELVRVKKNGKAISMATGKPVGKVEEESTGAVRVKRSASQEAEDEEEIMRSMARRKKNPTPEELAPKRCREPGCTKEFKRPCDLTKHEKTHSRPWKCPVPTCKYHEYGWPTEKEMDRHHNDKHSSNPAMYECLFKPCTYKSKRDSNRKQHMEKAHGWTYVRTKANMKKNGEACSVQGSTTEPTPQLQNIPTPSSDHSTGVATPPDDQFDQLYGNMNNNGLDFPAYNYTDTGLDGIPQDLKIDYNPADEGTPSSDLSRLEYGPQDFNNDFTLYEDIYSATARVPTPPYDPFQKALPQQFPAFTTPEFCQPQPAPHISPTGQANAMLFTPISLADEGFDENGFDENPDLTGGKAFDGDFVLFSNDNSKPMLSDPLFMNDVPSLAAGFSQPNSQDFLNSYIMDWTATNPEYKGFGSQN